jgi:hypothetical protein
LDMLYKSLAEKKVTITHKPQKYDLGPQGQLRVMKALSPDNVPHEFTEYPK